MNGTRRLRTGIRLALSVSMLVAGCSSQQSETSEEVSDSEVSAPLSSSGDVATEAEISVEEILGTSGQDATGELAKGAAAHPVELSESGSSVDQVSTTMMPNDELAATSLPPTTRAQVADIDLVACANVEAGYLFLLNGQFVEAEPVLSLGSNQSMESPNPRYVAAATSLSAAVGSEQLDAADAFLALCEADGFERLA